MRQRLHRARAPTRPRSPSSWNGVTTARCRLLPRTIARIRNHGIGVVGSFILGIDSRDPATMAADIARFADEASSTPSIRPSSRRSGHAALRRARRRRPHPVQNPQDWEMHARLPGLDDETSSGAGDADAWKCCGSSRPGGWPSATGGRATPSLKTPRGMRCCGIGCGRTCLNRGVQALAAGRIPIRRVDSRAIPGTAARRALA